MRPVPLARGDLVANAGSNSKAMIRPSDLEKFDLPVPPPGWHDYDYRPLDDGKLALVRLDIDLPSVSPQGRARAWTRARLRLSCFDGAVEGEVLELAAVPWPKVDRLPDGRWLVVQSRCSWTARNASIFHSDGSRAEGFSVGHGVGPILCLPDGRLFVGYIDEGVFGDHRPEHPASSGLAAWDFGGECVWRFAHEEYVISDCYALGATGTIVWACTYADFPIIRVDQSGVRIWQNGIEGAFAIAANDSYAILAGGYQPDSNRLVLLRLNETQAVPIDERRLATNSGEVKWIGRNGTMHAIADKKWLRFPIDDWTASAH